MRIAKKMVDEITQRKLIQKLKAVKKDLGQEDLSDEEKKDIDKLIKKINDVLDFEDV